MTRMSNLRSKCPLHFAESALRSEQKKHLLSLYSTFG